MIEILKILKYEIENLMISYENKDDKVKQLIIVNRKKDLFLEKLNWDKD